MNGTSGQPGASGEAMTPRRSADDVAAQAHALRAAGQAAAVSQMIRRGSDYESIVQQLHATRGSLDSLLVRLVEREMAGIDHSAAGSENQVARVLRSAFDRSRRTHKSSPSLADGKSGQ
jgi:DNA-binding FrmR family transcriptional regulator